MNCRQNLSCKLSGIKKSKAKQNYILQRAKDLFYSIGSLVRHQLPCVLFCVYIFELLPAELPSVGRVLA